MKTLARWGLALGAIALVLGTAVPARGAVLWTLTASPLTVTTGVRTTFSLRASMTLLGAIRCVDIGVPANFTVHGASVVGSNAGSWASQVNGNEVLVNTSGGGLRLVGNYVDFRITATASSTGGLAWESHAHALGDCGGAESLLSAPPVVVVLGPAVTPTPAPTIAPTPRPTATPGPSLLPSATLVPSIPPLPSLPLPSTPLPSLGATPRPSPSVPGESASPSPTDSSPGPSAEPSPTGSAEPSSSAPSQGGAASQAEPGASPPPGQGTNPATNDGTGRPNDAPGSVDGRLFAEPGGPLAPSAAPVPVALGALGLLGSIDVWIVPGLLLGIPGLLVVAFVALQALGALAWLPAIRRLRGQETVATR